MSTRLIEPEDIGTGTKRSLILSVITTVLVAVAPTFIAFALLVFSQPSPNYTAAVGLAIALTIGALVAGSALWRTQPESAGIAFGDLMLWNWVRHYQAERTLFNATATLGFDRHGKFIAPSTATPEEQMRAMRSIAKALDAKSSYTLGHSRRVSRHSRHVGEHLGLEESSIDNLALAALLHDVGNVALSEDVLRKTGQLTPDERADFEASVLLGSEMVQKAGLLEVVQGIRHHHERFDGRGYPDSLNGEAIPEFARIVAIAEAFDAMTSTRPYRRGFSTREATDVLRAESGSQFDPDLVEAFIATLPKPSPFARFAFLTALSRHFREVWIVLRRIGAVAISATASTVVIALILGSAVLSPGTREETPPVAAANPGRDGNGDSVLGERVQAGDDAVSAVSDAVTEGDEVLGEHITNDAADEGVLVATVQGPPVDIPDGSQGGPGNPGAPGGGPGPGVTVPPPPPPPPTNGGTDPEPTPPPGNGGETPPPDNGGEQPPPGNGGEQPPPGGSNPDPEPTPPPEEDPKDKNPDSPGNGYAHGHDDDGDAPGNSGNGNDNGKGPKQQQ